MDKIVENRLRFLRRILDFIHNNFNTREKILDFYSMSPPNITDSEHKHKCTVELGLY
jgi:hypothetical protein